MCIYVEAIKTLCKTTFATIFPVSPSSLKCIFTENFPNGYLDMTE